MSGFQLAGAYAELQRLLLEMPDVAGFLTELAGLAAQVVTPRASCAITLRRDSEVYTAATSDSLAIQVDEVQYGTEQGPCLQSLDTGAVVEAPDLVSETRWGDYRSYALAHGVRSSLSLPLSADGRVVGALNLYGTSPGVFTQDRRAAALSFAAQASAALTLALRQADQAEVSEQLSEALASRGVIDQALGIVMCQQGCTAAHAFQVLRSTSQNRNRKLRDVAAELIEAVSGEPPEPPPSFTRR